MRLHVLALVLLGCLTALRVNLVSGQFQNRGARRFQFQTSELDEEDERLGRGQSPEERIPVATSHTAYRQLDRRKWSPSSNLDLESTLSYDVPIASQQINRQTNSNRFHKPPQNVRLAESLVLQQPGRRSFNERQNTGEDVYEASKSSRRQGSKSASSTPADFNSDSESELTGTKPQQRARSSKSATTHNDGGEQRYQGSRRAGKTSVKSLESDSERPTSIEETDNYPDVYKRLKSQGTSPTEIQEKLKLERANKFKSDMRHSKTSVKTPPPILTTGSTDVQENSGTSEPPSSDLKYQQKRPLTKSTDDPLLETKSKYFKTSEIKATSPKITQTRGRLRLKSNFRPTPTDSETTDNLDSRPHENLQVNPPTRFHKTEGDESKGSTVENYRYRGKQSYTQTTDPTEESLPNKSVHRLEKYSKPTRAHITNLQGTRFKENDKENLPEQENKYDFTRNYRGPNKSSDSTKVELSDKEQSYKLYREENRKPLRNFGQNISNKTSVELAEEIKDKPTFMNGKEYRKHRPYVRNSKDKANLENPKDDNQDNIRFRQREKDGKTSSKIETNAPERERPNLDPSSFLKAKKKYTPTPERLEIKPKGIDNNLLSRLNSTAKQRELPRGLARLKQKDSFQPLKSDPILPLEEYSDMEYDYDLKSTTKPTSPDSNPVKAKDNKENRGPVTFIPNRETSKDHLTKKGKPFVTRFPPKRSFPEMVELLNGEIVKTTERIPFKPMKQSVIQAIKPKEKNRANNIDDEFDDFTSSDGFSFSESELKEVSLESTEGDGGKGSAPANNGSDTSSSSAEVEDTSNSSSNKNIDLSQNQDLDSLSLNKDTEQSSSTAGEKAATSVSTEPSTTVKTTPTLSITTTEKLTTKNIPKTTLKATTKSTPKPTSKPTSKSTPKPTSKPTSKPTPQTAKMTTAKPTTKPTPKTTAKPTTQKLTSNPTAQTTTITITITTNSSNTATTSTQMTSSTEAVNTMLYPSSPKSTVSVVNIDDIFGQATSTSTEKSLLDSLMSFASSSEDNSLDSSIGTSTKTPKEDEGSALLSMIPEISRARPVTQMDVPFFIYGLYPNGTVLRRFPNGTIVPEEDASEEVEQLAQGGDAHDKALFDEIINRVPYRKSLTTSLLSATAQSSIVPLPIELAPSPVYIPSTTEASTTERTTTSTPKPTTTTATLPSKSTSISSKSTSKPPMGSTNKPVTSTKSRPLSSSTVKTTQKPTTMKTVPSTKQTAKTTQKPLVTKAATTVAATTTVTMAPTSTTERQVVIRETEAPKKTTTASTTETSIVPFAPPTTPTPSTTSTPVTTASTTSAASKKPTTNKVASSTEPPKMKTKSTAKPETKATTKAAMIVKAVSQKVESTSKKTETTAVFIVTPTPVAAKSTMKKSSVSTTTTTLANDLKVEDNQLTALEQTELEAQDSENPSSSLLNAGLKPDTWSNDLPVDQVVQAGDSLTPDHLDVQITSSTLTPERVSMVESMMKLGEKSPIVMNMIEKAKESGEFNTDPSALANKIIALALEKSKNMQTITTSGPDLLEQNRVGKSLEESSKTAESDAINNATLNQLLNNDDIAKLSQAEILNAILSSPDILGTNANQITSYQEKTTKKPKKKPAATTTTTNAPSTPPFRLLGLLSRFRNPPGGSLSNNGDYDENDGPSDDLNDFGTEEDNNGRYRDGLLGAVVDVTRAMSKLMATVVQGATRSLRSFLRQRTRSLAQYLTSGSG